MRAISGIPVPGAQKSSSRSGLRPRDDSPDSVILTQGSAFSLFSSASGSVDRYSFGSDAVDHESGVSEIAKASNHLAGREHHETVCGPDSCPGRTSLQSNANPFRDQDGQGDEEDRAPAKNVFSQAVKECQNRRLRSESLPPKKHERRRPASLDFQSRGIDATISSPRLPIMKKTSVNSRRSGTFPSPGTPGYPGGGVQKGWSSERVPLPANSGRRYANCTPFPFSSGKGLPSKWEDAEKWIFSPAAGDGGTRPSMAPPPQRRPKSKSGPLGPPGYAYYASASPLMMPVFDGGGVGTFMGNSPFSAGVLGMEALTVRRSHGNSGVAECYGGSVEPCIARSASAHGWSGLSTPASLPSSQDEKLDVTRDAATMISPVISRRDMATQMSPERSGDSSPPEENADCGSLSSGPTISEHLDQDLKLEVRDVQVDDCVTVVKKSKKNGSCRLDKGLSTIVEWRKKAMEVRSTAWDASDATKSISKLMREEAKINAWENLQKAKAEAEIRKLEMKLEKIRTSSMDKIMNKLRSVQRKAQDMRSSVSSTQVNQVARTSGKTISFGKAGYIGSLSGCFTCHAY